MGEWERSESLPFPSVWVKFQGKKEVNGAKREYWIQDITQEYVEDVVGHMTRDFAQEEALCKYSGLYDDKDSLEEFANIWRELLSQKVGIVCLTKNEKGETEIAGMNCTYMSLQEPPELKLKEEKSKRVYDACKFLCQTVDLFKTFGVDRYITAMGLYVFPKFRGEGIGEALLRAREHLCKALGVKATATIFTSTTSQFLAERIGYKDLFSISYEAFVRVDRNFIFPGIEEAAQNIRFMYLLYE